jgi:hypothetical protein
MSGHTVHGLKSHHLTSDWRLGVLSRLVAVVTVELCAIQLRLYPTWLVTSSQTTIDEWQIQAHAPKLLCQN